MDYFDWCFVCVMCLYVYEVLMGVILGDYD